MKKSVKAALLSALVFPGCGHFVLRRYKTACALLLVTLVTLGVLIDDAMTQAKIITDKILANEIPLDPQAISDSVMAATAGGDSLLVSAATWALTIAWLIGIIDAYRVGRDQETSSIARDL